MESLFTDPYLDTLLTHTSGGVSWGIVCLSPIQLISAQDFCWAQPDVDLLRGPRHWWRLPCGGGGRPKRHRSGKAAGSRHQMGKQKRLGSKESSLSTYGPVVSSTHPELSASLLKQGFRHPLSFWMVTRKTKSRKPLPRRK